MFLIYEYMVARILNCHGYTLSKKKISTMPPQQLCIFQQGQYVNWFFFSYMKLFTDWNHTLKNKHLQFVQILISKLFKSNKTSKEKKKIQTPDSQEVFNLIVKVRKEHITI